MNTSAETVFHKMHGAGNDFVLLDLRNQPLRLDTAKARFFADRQRGIGCDQLLILYPPGQTGCVARYEIRNADGSQAGQCGNGARCIALYLDLSGEMPAGSLLLDSPAGNIRVDRCDDGEYEVDMGEPEFDPGDIPVDLTPENGTYQVESPWGPLKFGAASMGNPHALVTVEHLENVDIAAMGTFLSKHPAFAQGCNAGFAEVVDRAHIRLRVFERGSGETLACGSGACAAVAILRRAGHVTHQVNVFLPGGHLVIKWRGAGDRIRMKGPAAHVFRGSIVNE